MSVRCDDCNGACCRFVAVKIGHLTPDERRWAEMHGAVLGACWALPARCKHLTPKGRCGIYETRPDVCRGFAVGGEMCRLARTM